ncbi:MAG: protein-glutamate O-methyltransferase CheR [Bacteroidota bacterium]
MNQDQQQVQLPAPLFALLRDYVHEKTGIYFSDENAALFAGKLRSVMTESGYSNCLDYYHLLKAEKANGPELQRLISAITVGETWFFREMSQLNALVSTVLPRLFSLRYTKSDPVRIWSAACATGEEPLTLAMLIDEMHPEWFSQLSISATDINTAAIERAKSGLFRERAFRHTPAGIRQRYFQASDGLARIDPTILSRVSFSAGNMLDRTAAGREAPYDIILCRNVLIYFNEQSTFAAMKEFKEFLRPDGYLLLGSSESLLRYSLPWSLTEIDSAFFYKPLEENALPKRELS